MTPRRLQLTSLVEAYTFDVTWVLSLFLLAYMGLSSKLASVQSVCPCSVS